MEAFLRKEVNGGKFELVIDTEIFSKDIILKSAFVHLDIGYFFFKYDKEKNIILQFTSKDDVDIDSEKIIGEFSDTLLETTLRDKLEKDNKIIREAIVEKAINGPLDSNNFVTFYTDAGESPGKKSEKNQIDFDKDIDEILKEIEEDPELHVDEKEIEKILKEIENETLNESQKPVISASLESLKNAKDQFKKK